MHCGDLTAFLSSIHYTSAASLSSCEILTTSLPGKSLFSSFKDNSYWMRAHPDWVGLYLSLITCTHVDFQIWPHLWYQGLGFEHIFGAGGEGQNLTYHREDELCDPLFFVINLRYILLQGKFLFLIFIFYRGRVASQSCVGFCLTMKSISHVYAYVLSLLDLPPNHPHSTPLSHQRARSWAPCATQQPPASCLFHTWPCTYVGPILPIHPTLLPHHVQTPVLYVFISILVPQISSSVPFFLDFIYMHLCVFDPYYNKFNKFLKNGPNKKNLEKKKRRHLNTEKQTQRGKDGLVKTETLSNYKPRNGKD